MPIPKPRKGEKQDAFHSRCTGDEVMLKDYPDQKQRNAVCYSAWERKGKKPNGNESFATITANLDTSEVTTRKYKGKEYLVAPTVMIRTPIVMNGLRYTAEEVQKFPAAWDGRPVTLFHPKDEEGDYVSANHSAVPEDVHLGMLRNTRFENGVLRSEAWVEKEHTKATRPEVLEYYEGKKQGLQVSTGLFHDFLAVPGKMEDGTHYNGDVINIRPDHLALLPGGQGACSWEDGCGLRANEDCIEGFTRFFVAGMSDIELRQALSAAVSKMAGDYYNFIEAIYQDDKQLIYEENTKSGTKLKRCSYSIDKNGVATLGADAEEVYRKVIYEPVSKGGLQVSDTNTSSGPATGEQIVDNNRVDDFMKGVSKMAMDDKKRKAKVDGLIACQRCKFEEKDREWLMSLNEEQLELVSPPDNVIVKPAEEPKPKEEPKANKEEPKAGNPVVQKSPMTAEEWLMANQDVPQEIRDTLADSLLTNRAVRDGLVKQITEDKRNQYTANELQAKPTSELKKIAAFLAQEEVPAQEQQQVPFYGAKGFGAVPQANQDDGNKGPEPLSAGNLFDEIKKDREKK